MKTKWILLIILSLVCIIVYQGKTISDRKERVQVLEGNQESLLKKVDSYRKENGALVEKSTKLQLTLDELKEYSLISESKLKEMDVKCKNLQSYINVLLESKLDTAVNLKDTIIVSDTVPLKVKKFFYSDNWYRCTGLISNNKADLSISCKHDITVVSEGVYKGWWIFRKLKKVVSTVYVTNPYDTIVKTVNFDVKK